MKLKDLLNEITTTIKESIGIKVKDLTFDIVKNAFNDKYQDIHFTRKQPDGSEGPYYRDGVGFTNGDGSSSMIGDMNALETWKSEILNDFGNVEVILNPMGNQYGQKVFIEDPKFKEREARIRKSISAYYDSKKSGEFTGD